MPGLGCLLLFHFMSFLLINLLSNTPHSLQRKPSSGGINDGLTSTGSITLNRAGKPEWFAPGHSGSASLAPCLRISLELNTSVVAGFNTRLSIFVNYVGSRCLSSFEFLCSGPTVVVFPSPHDLSLTKCPLLVVTYSLCHAWQISSCSTCYFFSKKTANFSR